MVPKECKGNAKLEAGKNVNEHRHIYISLYVYLLREVVACVDEEPHLCR